MASEQQRPSILMIVTSHDHLGSTGEPTGLWLEELAAPYVEFVRAGKVVPFLLETALRARGARFEAGPSWAPFTVTDGHLITGQNPNSSALAAREVLTALKVPVAVPATTRA